MKSVISFISILIFISCMSMSDKNHDRMTNASDMAHELLSTSANEIQKKFPLRACGKGISMPGGGIKKLTLCFDTKNAMSKDELRTLLLDSSVLFLDLINKDAEIANFLTVNPFSIKNIQIIIYNRDSTGRECFYPKIATAELSREVLTFSTLESAQKYVFNNHYKETYEEALKLSGKNL